jgi:hypothetical protein
MRPSKTSLPNAAAAAQQNVAAAMKRYPRTGCGLGEHAFELFGVKADHHLVAHHQGRGRTALILVHQVADGLLVAADVTVFKFDPSLREVGLSPCARRSTGLAEENNLVLGHET